MSVDAPLPSDAVPEACGAEDSLAELVARKDWSSTPLGRREEWPASLDTALGICLESRFPIVIFWGVELVQLYNDAYRTIIGSQKHPGALGQRAASCWPEIWDRIGPMLAAVIGRGEATWSDDLLLPLDRRGLIEDAYFTFSYSPIRDRGGVGGVFCAVTETTSKVLREHAERRRANHLRFLSDASDVVLTSIREPGEILTTIAKTAVPLFAEWCGVYRQGTNASIETVALEHADPALASLGRRMHAEYPLRTKSAVARVIRSGEPFRLDDVTERAREREAEDGRHLGYLRTMALRSIAIFPLRAFGEAIGAITLATSAAGRRFDDDDIAVASVFAKRVSMAYENALLYAREHRVADAMQSASLPRALPCGPGLQLNAVYVPGRSEAEIGGDWYDAFRLRDGRVVLSIGDVAGNGLDAAVTMSNMRQIIRGTAQVRADPVLMLNAADRALRLEDPNRFVTAFVGVLDPVTNELIYASAGHPSPYVRHPDGRLEELTFIDPPLGLRQRSESRAKAVRLPDRALVVFYTDGLIEWSRDLAEGIDALENALRDVAIADAEDPARTLESALLPNGARDDVAILTLRIDTRTVRPGVRRWQVDEIDGLALNALRREVRGVLEAEQFGARNIESAELVLAELVGNVVRYAPGPIDVALDTSGSAPVLHVMDGGPGFERTPMLPVDVLSESGRGLFIVAALTEEFNVSRRPERGSHARAVLARAWRETRLTVPVDARDA